MLTLIGFLAKHNAQKSCNLEVFTEYIPNPGAVYGGPVMTIRCLNDQEEFSHQLFNVSETARRENTETAPFKTEEMGRYICVPSETCLFRPDITIRGHGVWVKGEHSFSSSHRECHNVREGHRAPVDMELYKRTAPAFNCITYPGVGMHYLGRPDRKCAWCGRLDDEIREGEI